MTIRNCPATSVTTLAQFLDREWPYHTLLPLTHGGTKAVGLLLPGLKTENFRDSRESGYRKFGPGDR
jgi:hypothetical protein